jgi:thermitase
MRSRPDRSISLLVSIALTVAIVAPSGVASASSASGTGRFTASRRAAVASGDTEHKGSRFPVKARTFGTSGAPTPSVADAGLPGAAADTTILVDPLAPSIPGELVVALDSVVFAASSERALEARGATVEKLKGDSAALLVKTPVGVSDPVFTEVAEDAPGVAWVQPNYIYRATYTPSDPLYGSGSSGQWGLRRIGAPAAWDVTRGDARVVVAVVDTGVDYTHPDLASQVDTANDWDFINGDSNAMDDHGHGTHVSGIIAATMDNGVGGVGVAPQVRILPVKVLDSKGSGDTFGVSAGIRYAADNGARIINLSLAGPSDASMGSAVAYAQSRGCVVIAAAGNDGSSGGASYPARYSGVIGVGATTSTDAHASFSNWGTGVDIAAPGVNILSTLPTALYPSGYGSWSGTSMATPFVAGVAALVMSANATTNPDVVIPRLLSTAQDLGYPDYFGNGLVRADLAVEGPVTDPDSEIPGVPLVSSPVTGTLDWVSDRDDVYSIYLSTGQTLEASMTGSPYPGTDFDLALYPPDAAGLEDTASIVAGSWSPGSAEHFAYTAPVGGEYYLDVSAFRGAGSYTLRWKRGGVSDDNIPGIALPASPVNGTLDQSGDEFDVYHVDLIAGEQLSVEMAGPPTADYDLWLFAPGSTSIYTDAPLATRESTAAVETMRYVAKTSGIYYLAVRAWEGSGPYQMDWVVDPYSPDDNIPGVAIPPSSFEATVGGLADDDDVYKVFLQAGQSLAVTVTTEPQPGPDPYPWLFLYPPTATDVELDAGSTLEGYSADGFGLNYFSHVATSTGYFYVDLYSLGDPVGYTLEWRRSTNADNNIPGAPAPASPVDGELGVSTDTDDVYRIHAHAGQWISASMDAWPAEGTTTTDFDLYLYPPGSTSTTSTPLAVSDGGVYPKSFALKAPTSGDYYLQAHAFAGEGTYSLSWFVRSFATVYKPVAPSKVTHSHHFTVYGYVAPRHTRDTYLVWLKFYKRDSHGVYVFHNSVRARRYYYSSTKTKYKASVSLPHKGAWRVRAMHRDRGLPDVYSVYDYITVR